MSFLLFVVLCLALFVCTLCCLLRVACFVFVCRLSYVDSCVLLVVCNLLYVVGRLLFVERWRLVVGRCLLVVGFRMLLVDVCMLLAFCFVCCLLVDVWCSLNGVCCDVWVSLCLRCVVCRVCVVVR